MEGPSDLIAMGCDGVVDVVEVGDFGGVTADPAPVREVGPAAVGSVVLGDEPGSLIPRGCFATLGSGADQGDHVRVASRGFDASDGVDGELASDLVELVLRDGSLRAERVEPAGPLCESGDVGVQVGDFGVVFGDVARFAFDLLAQADDLAAVFASPPRPVQVGEFVVGVGEASFGVGEGAALGVAFVDRGGEAAREVGDVDVEAGDTLR